MTIMKWKSMPSYPSILENFLNNDRFEWPMNWGSGSNVPAVNIKENKDNFEVEVAAPGLEKGDFKVKVENDTLLISCEKKNSEEESNDNYTRKEFNYTQFQRTFHLPETVECDNVAATYKNGVLEILIPKKELAKTKEPKEIKIS